MRLSANSCFNFMVYFLQPIGMIATTCMIGYVNIFDLLVFIQGVCFSFMMMELFIRYSHQYLWHGPLWFLHKIHHQHPNNETLDENDLLGMGNAVWIILLIALWSQYPDSKYFVLFGSYFVGLILYGTLVLYLHDGLSHKRFNTFWLPCKKKLRYEAAIHLRHHKTKDNNIIGVKPYGFFLASSELKHNIWNDSFFMLLFLFQMYLFNQ